ncbi:MAG: hypothetical protein WD066_07375 [Planctomycetaceae bacterium]
MPPADASAAVPLIVFAAVSLAAGGGYAFGSRPRRTVPNEAATNDAATAPLVRHGQKNANAVSRDAGAAERALAWMLALPGVWLIALWAADARTLSPRGVAAGLLVGVLIAVACLRLARHSAPPRRRDRR